MTLTGAVIASSGAALLVASAVSGLVAWSGPADRPRERGAHDRPTPTAGGLGVIAGACVGFLLFGWLAPRPQPEFGQGIAALGFASALGFLGALDDIFDLGAKLKLLVQVVLAVLFAAAVARIQAIPITDSFHVSLGPVAGVIGTALWIVVVVNAVNFMDGANGLAPGALAIILVGFSIAAFAGGDGWLGGAALMGAAAGSGFLPWNFPRARLFQGDAGALFSGFLIAALAVIGGGPFGRGPISVFFAPLALLPFLADVLLTLLRRTRARKRLLDAHNEHLYQRWMAQHDRSHPALAWRAFAIVALFTGFAIGLQGAGFAVRTAGFIAALLVAVSAWAMVSRRNPGAEH